MTLRCDVRRSILSCPYEKTGRLASVLANVLKASPLYHLIRTPLTKHRQRKALREWDGRSVPVPHLVKQRTLIEYAERYGLKVLIETGTYYGDMVEAMKQRFDEIFTIELGQALYERANHRFKAHRHIHVLHGDSSAVLRNLVPKLTQPTLFWLDGHYSSGETARGEVDTPIIEEMLVIVRDMKPHFAVVIDDARCFGSDPAYPSIERLRHIAEDLQITVKDDSIRLTPR